MVTKDIDIRELIGGKPKAETLVEVTKWAKLTKWAKGRIVLFTLEVVLLLIWGAFFFAFWDLL